MSLFLGFVGGLVAVKLMSFRRHGRWRHRGGGWHIVRQLGLSWGQKRQLWEVASQVRGAASELRRAHWGALGEVGELLASDDFNRTAAEELGARQTQNWERLREQVIAGLERAHQILTPEQRTKLREHLGVMSNGGEGFGPYRTAGL